MDMSDRMSKAVVNSSYKIGSMELRTTAVESIKKCLLGEFVEGVERTRRLCPGDMFPISQSLLQKKDAMVASAHIHGKMIGGLVAERIRVSNGEFDELHVSAAWVDSELRGRKWLPCLNAFATVIANKGLKTVFSSSCIVRMYGSGRINERSRAAFRKLSYRETGIKRIEPADIPSDPLLVRTLEADGSLRAVTMKATPWELKMKCEAVLGAEKLRSDLGLGD